MDTKEQVLAMLAAAEGAYVSGEELARRAGVSRAAVWKAIAALRASGCEIGAATNRGYALLKMGDALSAEAVRARLPGLPLTIRFYESCPGTNSLLKDEAARGAPEGTVLLAAAQTAGRGRYGRSFFSPPGTGVYMSILLRPACEPVRAQLLTSLAAVAAARACETVSGETIGVKWVNDLYRGGRKICGILTEAGISLETGTLEYAVVGLGFNVLTPAAGWPADIADKAGALWDAGQAPEGARARLAAEVLRELWSLYQDFDSLSFMAEYGARQLAAGKEVEILAPAAEPRTARAIGTDELARLIVENPDGSREALSGGEVRIKLKEGTTL